MGLKPDHWIKKMALEHTMIEPFCGKHRCAKGSSYGVFLLRYDIRVTEEFKIFTNVNSANCKIQSILTPLDDRFSWRCASSRPTLLHSHGLSNISAIPRKVLTVCLGKSTYARCGIIVNVTPFEPEWEGFVTLEISNTTPPAGQDLRQRGNRTGLFLKPTKSVRFLMPIKKGNIKNQQGIILPKL